MTLLDKLKGHLHSGFSNLDDSVLVAFLTAYATELTYAAGRISDAVDQMFISSAGDRWLDFWGEFCNVAREYGETDDEYRDRIVSEVLRPRQNNIAIEMALSDAFGIDVSVTDVDAMMFDTSFYNGLSSHNGFSIYGSGLGKRYCLFDVEFGFDIERSPDISSLASSVRSFINRFRSAGTQLRTISLNLENGSDIYDNFSSPINDYAIFAVTEINRSNGSFLHDGSNNYSGTNVWTETP